MSRPAVPAGRGADDDASRNAGGGALGARLRRLSDLIDRDATRIYAARDIRFEQRWFGPLNRIARHGPISIGDIARQLRITHVSVIQATKSLEAAGLVESHLDPADGRRHLLALTAEGEARVRELAPIWAALDAAATTLDEEAGGVVRVLDRLDDALARMPLFERATRLLDRS